MQTAKTSGQFEKSVFEIRAIMENTRLIARCPFEIGDSWDKEFLNPITSVFILRNWVVLRLCRVLTIYERLRICSKYRH